MLLSLLSLMLIFSAFSGELKKEKIIIFVHGSVLDPKGYANPNKPKENILKGFLRGIWQQTNTEKSIRENMKNNFQTRKNRNQLFQEDKLPLLMGNQPGLHKIDKRSITPMAYEKIYETLKKTNSEEYYIFNWDGDLSEKSRTFYADILSEKIKELNENNEKQIDIYCHSHGGNLALLSAIKTKFHDIYLMGTPIGKRTETIISKIPKENYAHIYNIYSIDDTTQVKDPFFDLGFLPGRVIKNNNKKIYNIELQLEGGDYKIEHGDFFIFNPSKKHTPLLIALQNVGPEINSFEKENKERQDRNYIINLKECSKKIEISSNNNQLQHQSFKTYFNLIQKSVTNSIQNFYKKNSYLHKKN